MARYGYMALKHWYWLQIFKYYMYRLGLDILPDIRTHTQIQPKKFEPKSEPV